MDRSLVSEHNSELPEAHPQSQGSYAFLNHSTSTLPNNLSPSIDDKPLVRQKRKRTSSEDQAVLEAAYQENPKPDKTARLQLVQRVALGEKEVQIWFQNRRQSSRRKSRPLLPHEVAQYQLARSGANANNTPGMEHTADAGRDIDNRPEEREEDNEPRLSQASSDSIVKTESRPSTGEDRIRDGETSSSPVDSSQGYHQNVNAIENATRPDMSAPQQREDNPHLGYIANRRSLPSLPPGNFARDAAGIVPLAPRPESTRPLKKASSFVRLSMSFDGNATVMTKDDAKPSPPRASQVMLNLGDAGDNTHSGAGAVDGTSNPAPRASLHRSASGRSRDSRAWEFWCDKDARTESEDTTEKETNGSAADAIGLLRSASGRSILAPIGNKRSSLVFGEQAGDVKRARLDDSRRSSLQRSQTSFGRLQGKSYGSGAKPKPKLKYSESAVSVYVPGNESDKENWSPERHALPSREFTGPPLRKMLGEKRDAGNRTPRKMGHEKTKRVVERLPGNENADPEADPEVSSFMRHGRDSKSLSSDDDLDCVQGLLSLSQGNWR